MDVSFFNTTLIPAGLMLIMFSLGLSLTLPDFAKVFAHPKPLSLGLFGQLLLLPCLAFFLAFAFRLPADIATGIVILAACPGGITSNAIVFAAKADVALSVSLTTITSFITVITTPLLISLALLTFYDKGNAPEIDFITVIKTLVMLTIVPVTVGMITRRIIPTLSKRLVVWFRPTSMVILVSVIAVNVITDYDRILDSAMIVGPAVLLLNIMALMAGTFLALFGRLHTEQTITIGLEVGIQNASMATFLVLIVLDDFMLSLVPSVYGVLMLMTAPIYVKYMRRLK